MHEDGLRVRKRPCITREGAAKQGCTREFTKAITSRFSGFAVKDQARERRVSHVIILRCTKTRYARCGGRYVEDWARGK
jgi:hypothetical protein